MRFIFYSDREKVAADLRPPTNAPRTIQSAALELAEFADSASGKKVVASSRSQ
jgi:hypothetical protein